MTTLDQLLGDPADAALWTMVQERSTVAFRCRSLWGLLPVKGTFTEFSGNGQVGNGTAFGRIDIDAASLTTGIGKRDEHLRSADFFAVERFPTISVVVTAVQPTGGPGGRSELRITLTVRGVYPPDLARWHHHRARRRRRADVGGRYDRSDRMGRQRQPVGHGETPGFRDRHRCLRETRLTGTEVAVGCDVITSARARDSSRRPAARPRPGLQRQRAHSRTGDVGAG